MRPSLVTVHLRASSYVAPLYHSLLLLHSPSLRTQLWPTGRRSPPSSIIVLWTALYQFGGTTLYRPLCSVLYRREGTALYRPLCSVLYSRGRGDGSLPSPVFDLYSRGVGTALYRPLCLGLHSGGEGTALYRPLCLVFYRREGARLSTVPCVRF